MSREWETTGRIRTERIDRLALVTMIPVEYLYVDRPAVNGIRVPEMVGRSILASPSEGLYEMVRLMQRRQAFYLEANGDSGMKSDFCTWFGTDHEPRTVAVTALKYLDLADPDWAVSPAAPNRLLNSMIRGGIQVFAGGSVSGHYLSPDEFKGFVLPHSRTPMVFINTNDTPLGHFLMMLSGAARAFLLHEGGHVSGRFCQEVVGEFLATDRMLLKIWNCGYVHVWQKYSTVSVSFGKLIQRELDANRLSRGRAAEILGLSDAETAEFLKYIEVMT